MSHAARITSSFLLSLSVLGPAAAAHAAPRLPLTACKLPGLEKEARCGTLEVHENRAARAGRKIAIRVVVIPAAGPDRAPDPIFYFAGGPGESATEQAAGAAQGSADLLKKRDVVLVDLRGTGESNGLKCNALKGREGVLGYLENFLPAAGVRACRQELEPRADLKLYTTSLAVDDVDDVRAALGYEKINVSGGSYGTFSVLQYLKRHGAHVRTAVLHGVVPPDTRLPLSVARDAQTALDQLVAACKKDGACRSAFPDPAADVASVLAKLEKEPAQVSARDPKTGEPLRFALSRNAAAQTLRYMLYLPATAAQIPLQMRMAARGEYGPFAENALLFAGLVASMSEGFYLSVTCTEDVAMFEMPDAERAARGTFLGDFRARAQKAACAEWPRGLPAEGLEKPVRSDVPTLLISGERDPVTPASSAERAARTLARSRSIVVPGAGHSTEGLKGAECVDRVQIAFIESGTEKGLDTSCVAKVEPVPFQLKDDRAPEVTLTSAEIERFPGKYGAASGMEVVVVKTGDMLRLELEGRQLALAPIGKTRFRILGAPTGFFADFTAKEDGGATLLLELGANGRETLTRK